ncbi:cobalt transporter [Bifidobacterium olomucense]|uniref:Cobalt transporter n=1 Tax=Bifidobacterium olomucense TaxID=2675324 RepID=A0A7Y0HX07_9BIFI|nr:cobalt transporter [Bifidobacterium sp. DSM 109959]NMM97847.1 cobalt transporter [Bifidobacterium sp. DSM 109959]
MGRRHNQYGVRHPGALTAWIMLPIAVFVVIVLLGVILLSRLLTPKQYVRSADDAYCAAISSDGTRHTLSPEQAGNAALIANLAVNRGLPDHAATVAIATAMQESRLTNLDHGDLDSLGLFQQRPSQGWGTAEQVSDPAYATNIFYDHLMQVPNWQTIPVEDAAQEVQRSGYPDLYANWDSMAHAWASALTGEVSAGVTCALEPANGSDANGLITAATAALPNISITKGTTNDDKHSNATTDSTLTVTLPAGLSDTDQQRVCWQTASWLVAHAREYGIDSATANGMSWNRTDGTWTGKETMQGTIIVTLG